MKKTFFYMMTVAVVLATACGKDDEPEELQNQITMTTQQSSVSIQIGGQGRITIDWGDKVIETDNILNPGVDGRQTYSHTYSGASTHTIKITCDNIELLVCMDNGLTKLDVGKSTKLWYLVCQENQLTNLDVSGNPELSILHCHQNKLTNLNVSNSPKLSYFYCDQNQLTKLDVSKNSALSYLCCSQNQLTNLDLSKNLELSYFQCSGNKLVDLDVSKNTELTFLSCIQNQLTKLDLSNNTKLRWVYCQTNKLASDALNAMFGTLNDNIFTGQTKVLYISGNPGTNDCYISIAEKKGWSVNL